MNSWLCLLKSGQKAWESHFPPDHQEMVWDPRTEVCTPDEPMPGFITCALLPGYGHSFTPKKKKTYFMAWVRIIMQTALGQNPGPGTTLSLCPHIACSWQACAWMPVPFALRVMKGATAQIWPKGYLVPVSCNNVSYYCADGRRRQLTEQTQVLYF